MKIGYHISIGKGLIQTAKNIVNEKMTAVQIFPGSPKSYFPGTKHTVQDFLAMTNLNIPKFVHINYFVNLADDKPVIPKSIAENMIFCDKINADGLVIHMGSFKGDASVGISKTIENLRQSQEKYKEISDGKSSRVKILIETTAEGGNRMSFQSILNLIESMPELSIVLDTAHMYAAGYLSIDIINIIEKYHNIIDLVHLNNPSSNVEFGKHKDQHDISLFDADGKFSKIEIENFINICNTYNISMILETGNMINDLLICQKLFS